MPAQQGTGWREIWRERLLEFLRGNALGDVPASAGSPPLVEDARRRARSHRIDLSDGASRRRRLDIRRKRSHLAASRYRHARTLLNSDFAEMRSGPDYLHGIRTDLLFEEWSYAWSPRVEGRLIELAALADDVPTACLNLLARRRAELQAEGQGRDLDLLAQLFLRGLLAGLGARLAPFLEDLASDIREHGDFDPVARVLRRLHFLAVSKGPLAVPPELDLDAVRETAYLRLVYRKLPIACSARLHVPARQSEGSNPPPAAHRPSQPVPETAEGQPSSIRQRRRRI